MKKLFLFLLSLHVSAFKLGIENISADMLTQLQNVRVGLVTNQTGVDQRGNRTIDVLRDKGVQVKAIYVPEHGLDGVIKAAHDIIDDVDKKTGLPILSLYKNGSGHISANAFEHVDTLVFDMQDVGIRHYTYISTLYTVMQAAAKKNKKIVVLDRPNPLGHIMEGPLCESSLRSFVGIAGIPLRHGMTIGELAQFFNAKCLKQKADLHVVPLFGYQRDLHIAKLPKHLSPNIKTLSSVHGYSFLGLLGEVRPFNVGVGTAYPFQMITLSADHNISERAWDHMRERLQEFGVHSKRYKYHCKKKAKGYVGLLLDFKNVNTLSGFKSLLTVLSWAKEQDVPISFSNLFDKAIGTKHVRTWYDSDASKDHLLKNVKKDLYGFLKANEDILLYQSHPKIVQSDQLSLDWLTI